MLAFSSPEKNRRRTRQAARTLNLRRKYIACRQEATTMALIEIRNLTKQYHKGGETITPLDDVSLDIEEGHFVSLMGQSGSGKSTLLNLVAGIDRADHGSIVINGLDITRFSRTKLAKWRAGHIGYIFQ